MVARLAQTPGGDRPKRRRADPARGQYAGNPGEPRSGGNGGCHGLGHVTQADACGQGERHDCEEHEAQAVKAHPQRRAKPGRAEDSGHGGAVCGRFTAEPIHDCCGEAQEGRNGKHRRSRAAVMSE